MTREEMTKEETIEILEKEKTYMLNHGGDRQANALSMAIKALELVGYIEERYEEECDERRKQYADGWYHSLSMCDGASYALGQVLDKWKESVGEAESGGLNGEIQR